MHHIYKRILYLFVFLCCAAISFKANAQYAIGGTAGNLTKSVYWLTWDNSTLLEKPIGWNNMNIINGTYSWQHSPNVKITAVISNKTGGNNMTKYTPGNWQGDGLDLMYSSNNLPKDASRGVLNSGLATLNNTTVTFDIEVKVEMLINGVSTEVDYPGMVLADAEELNGGVEYIQGTTTSATPWQVLNKRGATNNTTYKMTFSNLGKTFKIQPTAPNSQTQVVMFAHNTHKLTGVEMVGGGITAIALGFVLPFDLGDAPASYGDKVGHYIDNFQITDYFAGVGTHNVASYPETPLVPQATVYLGPNNNVDADGMPAPGANANSDNATQANDEETIDPAAIADLKVNQNGDYVISFLATNTKTGPATVYGWIDFNNDGKFTASELITVTVPPTTTNHQVTLTYPNAMFTNVVKPGLLYGRLRITTSDLTDDTSTPGVDERSVSYAADGETEDYKLKNILGVTVSGNVINDGNGLTDSQISGSGTGTAGTQLLYAYLVDQTNTIVNKVAVASNGSYSFTNTDRGTYTVAISTKNVAVGGNLTDIPATLPAGWNAVGDSYGIDNGNSQTGFETGVPDLQIPVVIPADSKDISALNFALNQSPVANNDEATTALDTDVVVEVLVNDTDPNGNGTINPTTVLLIDPADNLEKSSVTIAGQGVYTVDAVTGKVTFNPEPTFVGVATAINYTVKDNAGSKSNLGLLTVKVKPIGTADTDMTLMGVAVTTIVKANDGVSATSTSVSQVTPPTHGALVVNTDGTITYTPVSGYTGTDTYTYKLTTTDGVDSDPITVTITVYNPGITLAKEGTYNDFNANGKVDVGDRINYTFTVTNTGTVPVTNITIADPNATIAGGPIASLAVSASDNTTFTGYHVLTQAELDNGGVFNSATATGTDPKNNPVTTVSNDPTPLDPSDPNYPVTPPTPACPTCTVTELPQTGSMSLAKEGTYNDFNANGKVDVGDRINYTFTVTNTGNVTLTNVSIADVNANINGGPLASLAVGASNSSTFTGYHVLTQAELDNGGVFNTATATAKDPKGRDITTVSNDPTPLDPSDPNYPVTPPTPACPSCTVTELPQTGSMSLAKEGTYNDFNANGKVDVGDRINYTFTVTNTGNVTLTNVSIADANATINGGPLASLAVGASNSSTFTGFHVLTQAELDNGGVFNSATATAKDPRGKDITTVSNDPTPLDPSDPNYPVTPPTPACPSCTVTELPQAGSMSLAKEGTYNDFNANGKVDVGDRINYTFTVTNTGNVTLTNVSIADVNANINGGPIASLAVNASDNATFTGYHVLTQADIDNGGTFNSATATAKDPKGRDITTVSNDPTPLDPSDPNYPVTPPTPACPTCTVTELPQSGSMSLAKEGTYNDFNANGKVDVGDRINYTFTVTNTGNVTLTNVSIADANATINGGPLASLAVGASNSSTFTGYHVLTQAELDNGGVFNTATATAKDPKGRDITTVSNDPTPLDPSDPNYPVTPPTPACPSCTVTELPQAGSMSLAKEGTYNDFNANGKVDVGDRINYTFTVTNTGNVTLTNVSIADANAIINGGPLASLAVGASNSSTFTGYHVLTQAELDNGGVFNTATATAKDPRGKDITTVSNDPTPLDPSDPNYPVTPPTPACPTCTVTELPQSPSMTLSKVADNPADAKTAGDIITYTLTVQNTGNVTLTNIIVSDAGANAGSILPAVIATLAPNATATVKASHTLTQAEVNAGSYSNQASVTGKTPSGGTVNTPKSDDPAKPGTEDPTVVPILGTPAITLIKSGVYQDNDGNGKANAGDHINYTFKVTNTGNVTVSNISITDPKVQVTGGPVTLAPGASDNATFTAIYTITQDDLNKGGVYNLATASGTDPVGNKITGISTNGNPVDPNLPVDPTCPTCTITSIKQEGAIALTKTVTNTGTGQGGAFVLGNAIAYTFAITNTGNVTLNNIVLNDPLLGTASIAVPGSLAPGQTVNHIERYTIAAADIANGKVTNQATVNAKDPANNNVTDQSGTTATNNDPTVTALAIPPVAKDDAAETKQNFEVKIPVAGNDVPGNSELVNGSVKIVTQPQHGKVTVNPDGTVTYLPDNGYTGSDTFTYTITDKNGQVSNVATVQVNIKPTDPVATDDNGKTTYNTPVNIKVLTNDREDGSPFDANNIEIKSQPQHGTIRVNADGTITYTPNSGYTGPDEFSYRVKDANGNWTNIANVKVVVDGFFVPNVFTPDGDGINDTFFIVGAENYDAIDLEVYNRWGAQVYRKTRYQNDWTGEGLNGGTYYYVIKLRKASASSTLKGWVLIKR